MTSAEFVRLRRAVDDEGRARQRLEQGRDVAVGVEIMRPGGAAAQGQNAVRHRKRLVGANAEFGARGRDVLGRIVQRKGAGARQHLLGIGRQAVGGELPGGIGRDAHPWRHIAVAALDAAGIRVGVELGAQALEAGHRDGALGGHVLPAIGRGGGDIGGADVVANEGAGLEQVRAAGAETADAEIGAAAGERKTGQRVAREAIVGADRKTERARGRVVRSERGVARGVAAAAEGGAPDAPALIEQIVARDIRLGREFGKGVARGAGLLRGIAERALFGERDRAGIATEAAVAARHERIRDQRQEQVHGVEGRLLRSGRQFAGDLRQAGRRERGEADRNAAGGIEEIGQRVGDVLLVDVEAAAVVQREIQIDVVGVVAEASDSGSAKRQIPPG